MGAKYLPTIKDQKAAQRFQQKKNPSPFFEKSATARFSKKTPPQSPPSPPREPRDG
jgi:hypothetical protein